MAFEYTDTPYPVRPDIQLAHQEYWKVLASPGSWWTGSERVAIAHEARAARTCGFCIERKSALSPYSGEYQHVPNPDLPMRAVDAVHRIITDQSRITQSFIEDNAVNGMEKEAYVELVGVVVAIISIDEFHRSLGMDFEILPLPEEGDPDHYRPAHLSEDTGFVPMLSPGGNTGNESDLWGERTANVLRALSSVPDAVRSWMALGAAHYLSVERMAQFTAFEDRSLDRAQMELVASRVSAVNECFY